MTKTLKLATIEKRFKKLHDVANFAEDYANAIASHVQLIIHEGQSDAQCTATMNMVEQIDDWTEKFAPLASEMQRVESLYYATADGDSAELIEPIPSMTGYPTQEPYKMTEELCKIGYIEIEGDPYLTSEKDYSDEDIVTNVQNLTKSLLLCVRALANGSYQGVWSDAGTMASEIYATMPIADINGFLTAYGRDEAQQY